MTKPSVCITGASSGIGRDTALLLAERGYPLFLGARRMERLVEVCEEARELGSPSCHYAHLDVQDHTSILSFADAFWQSFDRMGALINNAGLALGLSPISSGDREHWRTMIDTNVAGLLDVTQRFLPTMIEAGSGHVINIGSIAAHQVYEGGAVYAATKHAVLAITNALRLELNGTGLRVSCIDPGMVQTEFSNVRLEDDDKADKVYQGLTPLTGRDVAECIEFVLSRPAHVNIDDMIVMPTAQASVYKVARDPV